jgi:hypothetical protein
MRTRELYSRTYRQFEVTPPSASVEESRALIMQATLAKNFKNKAERHKADYERERSKQLQKEKDLEEAEDRIKKLREELAFLEESFEVVAKRPLMKSELDSPELHAKKKVRIEEVPDNMESIKSVESIKNMEGIKSVENIKSVESIKKIGNIKKMVEVRSSGSKPKMESEEILELS